MINNSRAGTTKKCSCDNPKWIAWDVRVSVSGVATIWVHCSNCQAIWQTKSRKGLDCIMDKTIHCGTRTLRDVLKSADERRIVWLKGAIQSAEERIAEEQKEKERYEKELKEIEGEGEWH